MKRAKNLSTISKKLTSVPELPYKKGLLNSSPKLKEKRNAKAQHDKIEPMVLRSPPTGESLMRYALPIPSRKTEDLIPKDEMVRRIAKHLKLVVTALEDTYGVVDENRERTSVKLKEGVALSVGDDMNSFLLCCSQLATQLEEAVKEERNTLESVFKWFQQRVNQMEEISKDQSIFETDLPSDDKSVNVNITQIANLIHKFEELKSRLKGQRGSLMLKHMDKDALSESMKTFEAIEKQIEEFLKSHAEYESQVMSEIEPETPYSLPQRITVMIKIFENQTNMLERALNEQSIIETKYKQMETDFQELLLEKSQLESEIQKLKDLEKAKPTSKEDRTKKPGRLEKKKDPEKKPQGKELELHQIQKEAEELKMEKKALQEQLKLALQEAERNKNHLDFVLHQKMDMSKEDWSRMEMEWGEDSKYSPPGERDAQLGGPRQDSDQMSPEKSERLEKKRSSSADLDRSSLEGYYDVSDVSPSPPEVFKSFTELPLIKEHLESTLPPLKETNMWSLMSFPDLMGEIEKAEASEQVLSHTKAENFEDERPVPDDKDLLSEAQAPTAKQLASQGRRKPLFITAKTPENLNITLRTQPEIENLEAAKYENLNESEEPDKKFTKGDIRSKGQKGSKTGKLYAPDADVDGALSPDSPGSVSKADIQTKKQKMHKRERPTVSHEIPDKSSGHQDSELRFEIEAKKLKFFKPENVHSEVSDRSIKLEDQNVQSSSQVQLKKQKSLGAEIFTIHFAVPDESHVHLHQESLSEAQAQVERATTSEDVRFTVPLEYQKKDAPMDNLLLEKKLLITRNQPQNRKYVPSRDDIAEKKNVSRIFKKEDLESQSMTQQSLKAQTKSVTEVQEVPEYPTTLNPVISDIIFRLDMDKVRENDLQNVKESFKPHLLLNEFKATSKSRLEISTAVKGMPARPKSKKPVKTESKSKKDIKMVKGTKLLGTLKDQLGVSSLKTKPQENINAKYHPPMEFPTKVINLSPFASQRNMKGSSPYADATPKPFYRTSRENSGIPESFQHLLNRKISGDPNPKNENKRKAEHENQLHSSITSSKKYEHKGQSKYQKTKEKGTESHQNLHASASPIKKQKLKGKGVTVTQPNHVKLVARSVERPNNVETYASTPNIKVIKVLSKTSNLDDEDAKLSNNLPKSTSAAKKPTSKETSKTTNLDKTNAKVANNLKSNVNATGNVVKESSKMSNLENKEVEGSGILHKSTSSLKKRVHQEPSKTKTLDKDKSTPTLHNSTNAKKRRVLQEPPRTSNLDNHIVKGTSILHKSVSGSKKHVPKDLSKPITLDYKVAQHLSSLRISTSATKKNVLKEQPKHTTLDKKGVDLPNSLAPSTSASSKHGLKGQPKATTSDKEGVGFPNNLVPSGSASRQPTSANSDEKGLKLPDYLHPSGSTTRKHLLRALNTIP
ncbi:coiled-coil domain-containing protein 7 isoform X3 [Mesocricetus auratus]|uniref:Coiled-coil domain-containing protein 7 isoform X3 n=1 Tax=Mesocricetus auratus TaxID=10036 RepID=A0ABM2Y8Y0_MESAU|nr:coiled-coil domain-containing protein 7 isoform X3 [Mesocricetus auratus]